MPLCFPLWRKSVAFPWELWFLENSERERERGVDKEGNSGPELGSIGVALALVF